MTRPDPVTRASQTEPPPPRVDPRASGDPTAREAVRPDRRHARAAGTPPATRPPRRAGTARRRFGAALAATAALLGALAAGPAQAADDTPTPAPSPTLSGELEAFVSPTADGILRTDRPLSTWAALRNGTGYSVAASDVTLRLGTAPITTRAALTAWLTDGTAPGRMTAVGTGTIDPIDSGTVGRTLITVPADDKALTGLKPGVYPLAATIAGASKARTPTSVVVVPDEDAKQRTPVGLVVPITAGPLSAGLLTSDELAALTALDGALSTELNSVAGTSAILAIDPAIPAAIRVLGTSAPDSARDWLERLDALPNERFALQFGDADVTVQTTDGRSTLLAPTSLQSYMEPADFLPDADSGANADTGASAGPASVDTASPTPSPTATTGPNEPVYPTLEALQYLGGNTRDAVTWPFSGTAGPNDVAALGALSTDATRALTLVPSDTTSGATASDAIPAHATAGDADLLVYDSAASDALRTASTEEDPAVRGTSLAAATGYLELAADTSPTTPVLVVVDRSVLRSGLGLSAAVEAVGRAPSTRSASLSDLTAAPARPVTIADAAPHPERVTALSQLTEGERTLGSFASILTDPALLTGPERASILQLMGGGWIEDAEGWDAAIAAHREATRTTLAAVSIAPSSNINLAGTVANLGFGVRNDLPWPVDLTLITRPDDLRLEVQNTTSVVAHASSTTRVTVPVRAKIGNGEVTLELQLYSPTGVSIGSSQSVTVNVHAEWEAIGLTALGIAIGGFLVLGLIRTVIARRRRAAPEAAAENTSDDKHTHDDREAT
nr:DUF6049 family protein [Microbacterium bovistercoris]